MKMKIPKCFHPIFGVLIGAILFLIGIAILSVAFVAAYRMVVFAKPFVAETLSNITHHLVQCLPL